MTDEEAYAQPAEIKKQAEQPASKYPEVTFKSFLEVSPPDTYVYLTDLEPVDKEYPSQLHFKTPDILLFCDHAKCGGPRIFKCADDIYVYQEWRFEFLAYTCRNCASRTVRFAIATSLKTKPTRTTSGVATCLKIGQTPAFGPQTPARLITLIGPDRDIFLQGRRAENRGLGIGAFAYYRRVVENQKNRIIAEIARVAKQLGSSSETNAIFAAAINETRFTESLAMVKDVIPQTLMINGQNPLTLLHSALSKGLHNPEMTDTHCLLLAQSIRIVLGELAERASEALKNDKEIQSALSVLMAVPNGPVSTSENVDTQVADKDSPPEAKQ